MNNIQSLESPYFDSIIDSSCDNSHILTVGVNSAYKVVMSIFIFLMLLHVLQIPNSDSFIITHRIEILIRMMDSKSSHPVIMALQSINTLFQFNTPYFDFFVSTTGDQKVITLLNFLGHLLLLFFIL